MTNIVSCRFEVKEVDKPMLGRQEDDSVFFGYLHDYREVVVSLRREVYIDILFCEERIGFLMVEFNDV
jgi:hypothetical protein